MPANTLFIVRGPSGSGKTTLAEKLSDEYGCPYYEADQYFMKDGQYRFDPRLLPAAHNWCRNKVFGQLKVGDCIVSNTFTKAWEMEPYLTHVLNNRGVAVVIECSGNYKNVHGLSDEQVEKQRRRFDSMDSIQDMLQQTYGSELKSNEHTAHGYAMIYWLSKT
jgi:hypothetical protein